MITQSWKDKGLTKPEWLAREVAKAVNAGRAWDLEMADFADRNRPLTLLDVDFPIIPVSQIAAIEIDAGKPQLTTARLQVCRPDRRIRKRWLATP